MSGLWSPAVVQAVSRHMNDDHVEDSLLLVRALGGRPGAEAARMTAMDETGLVFAVSGDGGDPEARVAWLAVPVDRPDVRAQVVALHDRATAVAKKS